MPEVWLVVLEMKVILVWASVATKVKVRVSQFSEMGRAGLSLVAMYWT